MKHVSDRIAIMYLGRVVELAPADEIYHSARHPYTRALISAIPQPEPRRKSKRIIMTGDVPSPINPPAGCPFHPRCQDAIRGVCDSGDRPDLIAVEDGHDVACVLYQEEAARG